MACYEVGLTSTPQSRLIDDPWASEHFRCTLTGANARTVTVTVGCDEGPPEVADVLTVLGIEAATVEASTSFEDWAKTLGYDPDSRSAERIYRAARRRARSLRDLIGEDDYRRLLRRSQQSVPGIRKLASDATDAAGARSRRAGRAR